MQNYILLDIDDCLSCDRSILVCPDFDEGSFLGYRVPRIGDWIGIDLINRACRLCGAKAVISSLWVAIAGADYTIDWLTRNGFRREHLTSDPCVTYQPSGTKLDAIDAWMSKHPEIEADQIVAIDDDTTLFPAPHPLADRQVVIDGEDGVLLRHYREIVGKFGGTDQAAGVKGPWRFTPSDD